MGDHTPGGTGTTTTRIRAEEANTSGDDRTTQPPIEPGEAESAMGIARKICELGSQHLDEQTTSAIPGYSATNSAPLVQESVADHRRPISSIFGQPFPSIDLVYTLLDEYFDAVHWFSLVVHEPKFRRRLHSIADGCAHPAQRPFLLLLAVMLGMAAWYRSRRSGPDAAQDWGQWSSNLLKLAESNLMDMMDQPSVLAAQTCILIGSHNLYHGRPNLSFTLLGATIKMAHAIGLHREPPQGDVDEIEERKRVWWTIYTWDRFASITYGTPLGINDKDCNLSMPADVFEDPSFGAPRPDHREPICYSPYQRELNRLYLIASPALETIFGSRTSQTSQELVGDTFVTLVKQATENLQVWRRSLPTHLVLDLRYDFQMDGRQSSKAHALQALALQLTYDNILIVLHRPLIARQVDHLSTNKLSPGGSEVDPTAFLSPPLSSETPSRSPFEATLVKAQTASSEFWMKAAVRTSRVTEQPVLAQLATDSHLVAFLAISLFNAAIVLAVMALSDPLSDTAQEVKRTMTRILRLQDLLGKRSALSKQSTHVLKKVITMLLRRESAAMLAPLTGTAAFIDYDSNKQAPPETYPMSVEDTLRLPLDAPLDLSEPVSDSQGGSDVIRTHRLNDSLTSVQYCKHLFPGGLAGQLIATDSSNGSWQ
ncbi:putative C6 transcription factor [Aspergillus sclerotioniger CBS 115572]|uniref:Putative C6 transcription factor n=1 Tax=Aspergillus sclerotioniger CBS 115572 TaxID=1450535 RepID=A0A317W5A4_9EURO|nr:putative C6 transcription factor [Aspergillus sclerotioniger CBS 115572]PWY81744.1 putative C6 transcription factor [Aspergillus sclerotioniger CBS 115572]